MLNSLPNDKMADLTKLEPFADNKINVNQKLIFVLGRVQNIVGKGENAGFHHFLLLPQCFKRLLFQSCSKSGLCGKWLKHLTINHSIQGFNKSEREAFRKHCREMETMLVTSIVSLSLNNFYPIKDKFQFFIYIQFVICKWFQVGQVHNFVVDKRVQSEAALIISVPKLQEILDYLG